MELDLQQRTKIFCGGCDMQQADGTCRLGSADQVRYVIREECDWAQVRGELGFMSIDGFVPYDQPTSPEQE